MTRQKIKTVGDKDGFQKILKAASPEMQKVATSLRALIAEIYPGVTEVPWVKQRTAGYGVGEKKMTEQFCYIAPMKAHVNLGFFYGADLDDPGELLEGAGKKLRHVKVKSSADVKRAELKKLVGQASGHLPRLK